MNAGYLSWPNRLTIARILLIAPFVTALLHLRDPAWGGTARAAALAIFAVMAVSDALDGFLARKLHQETLAGRFLDPLADKLLILFSVVLLAREGTSVPGAVLPAGVAVVAVGKDIIVVLGFCIIYFTTGRVFIQPDAIGKLCTLAQFATMVAILVSPELPGFLARLPAVLWWTASVLAILTVISYFQTGRRFIARHESQL